MQKFKSKYKPKNKHSEGRNDNEQNQCGIYHHRLYLYRYIAKHGMPKMRFHDLRHSCASLLLANGVPLKQIQEWLGHSDFSTTANIYAHLDYRSKISSAQAMEQGMLLPRSDDFGSRWENVTEQGKITEPDLNPGF